MQLLCSHMVYSCLTPSEIFMQNKGMIHTWTNELHHHSHVWSRDLPENVAIDIANYIHFTICNFQMVKGRQTSCVHIHKAWVQFIANVSLARQTTHSSSNVACEKSGEDLVHDIMCTHRPYYYRDEKVTGFPIVRGKHYNFQPSIVRSFSLLVKG